MAVHQSKKTTALHNFFVHTHQLPKHSASDVKELGVPGVIAAGVELEPAALQEKCMELPFVFSFVFSKKGEEAGNGNEFREMPGCGGVNAARITCEQQEFSSLKNDTICKDSSI